MKTSRAAKQAALGSSYSGQNAVAPKLPLWWNRIADWLLTGLIAAYGLLWGLRGEGWWFDAASLTVGGALLFGIGWRVMWRRYLTYKEQWWLGEVAYRVADKYEVDWARIAQATRYRPIATGDRLWIFGNRAYRLKAKEDWWDDSPAWLTIVVPLKKNAAITVFEQKRGQEPVLVLPRKQSAAKPPRPIRK
jgi:hypothetical protein